MKAIRILSILAVLMTLISAGLGLLYTNGGAERMVMNIYGQEVILYGDGIYADNSLLKAGATKGTDVVAVAASLALLTLLVLPQRNRAAALLRSGLLAFLLYATTCLVMGVSFNTLFPLYVAQFGCTLFAFILSMRDILTVEPYTPDMYQRKWKGTGIFLILSGCSVLVWLSMILPAVLTGEPMEIVEIYTTEPTFVIDLAVVLPTAIYSGITLLRGRAAGYRIAPVLLTLLACIGLCVIFQTICQTSLGIELPMGQIIGLVGSFVCLGIFAVILAVRLMKYADQGKPSEAK